MRAKHNVTAPVMTASPPVTEDTVTCTMGPVTPPAVQASSLSSTSCKSHYAQLIYEARGTFPCGFSL